MYVGEQVFNVNTGVAQGDIFTQTYLLLTWMQRLVRIKH